MMVRRNDNEIFFLATYNVHFIALSLDAGFIEQ